MWPVATDVARSMVCLLGARVNCARTAEPIEMRVGDDYLGPKNHVLNGDPGRTNPLAAARGDK